MKINPKQYKLLCIEDFDPEYENDIKLYRNTLGKSKWEKTTKIKKWEVFEIADDKLKWAVKVKRGVFDEGEKENSEFFLPSSIFVPINIDENYDLDTTNFEDEFIKQKFMPEIGIKERKYFPAVFEYYENLIQSSSNPVKRSIIISRIFYSWLTKFIILGFRRYLVEGDLWTPTASKTVGKMCMDFNEKYYKKQVSNINNKNNASILKIFLSMNKTKFYLAIICKFLQDIIKFLTPFLIRVFINYFEYDSKNILKGALLSLGFFASKTIDSLLLSKFYEYTSLIGCDLRSLLSSLVYRKVLKARVDYLSKYSQGFQTNLISIDSNRVQDGILNSIMSFSCIFQIILCMIYLYFVMGLSFLAGIGVMLVILPVNFFIAKFSKAFEAQQLKFKDQRIKIINAILNGIKLVKLYSWEKPFEEMISNVRDLELNKLSKVTAISSFIYSFMVLTPALIVVSTFSAFIYSKGFITAQIAFESMAIFNILRFPVSFLPDSIRMLVVAKVSYKRFVEFLGIPEVQNNNNLKITSNSEKLENSENFDIRVENASFSFNEDLAPFFKNIDLHIDKPGIHIIIGANGSGKTQFLLSLINENILTTGNLEISGKVCYVPQTPWIRNSSLRNNIIEENDRNEEKYDMVKNLCELDHDIELLPDGDYTEIGEKGVNLSGGQKQRVGLARAIYTKSNIYLIDDPFSNLDKNVGRKIFQNILSSEGYLSDCVRIIVTHDDYYLQYADCVYVLKDGKIIARGNLIQLRDSGINIDDFLSPMKETSTEVEDAKNKNTKNDSTRQNIPAKNKIPEKLVQKDILMVGKVKSNIYIQYIKNQSIYIFSIMTVFLALNILSSVFGNLLIAKYTSNVIYKSNSTNFFIIYGSLTGSQCLLSLFTAIAQIFGSIRASKLIHKKLLNYLFKTPVTFFESNPVGRMLNAFTKEMSVVDESIARSFRVYLLCVFSIIFGLLGVVYFFPYALIGIFFLILVFYFVQAFYIKSSRQIQRLESLSRAPILTHMVDTIHGLSIIKCQNKQEIFIRNFELYIDKNSIPFKANMFCNRWLGIRLEIMANVLLLISAVIMIIIGYFGNVESGAVGYVLFTTSSITQTLSFLIRTKCDLENQIVSIERISKFYNVPFENEPAKPLEIEKNWPQEGMISFFNYSCRYRSHLPDILRNLNIKIQPREKVLYL